MGIPGCPVVKTPPSEAGGCWFTGSIPGQGAKIPHASWPKKTKHKKINNIVTNSIKISKIVHVKKKKKSLKELLSTWSVKEKETCVSYARKTGDDN